MNAGSWSPAAVLFNRSVIERQVWRDEWMTSIAAGMTTMIVTAIVAAIAMVVGQALLWPRWIASAAREYGIDPLVLRDYLANGPRALSGQLEHLRAPTSC